MSQVVTLLRPLPDDVDVQHFRTLTMMVMDTWHDGMGRARGGIYKDKYRHMCTLCDAQLENRVLTRSAMRGGPLPSTRTARTVEGAFNPHIVHLFSECEHPQVLRLRAKHLRAESLLVQLGFVTHELDLYVSDFITDGHTVHDARLDKELKKSKEHLVDALYFVAGLHPTFAARHEQLAKDARDAALIEDIVRA